MILLPCPHCGPRNVSEFHYVGELSQRPEPNGTNPEEWRAFLYLRENTRTPTAASAEAMVSPS